ncbi:MAG TPA: hypothetical protein VMU25_02215 [Candidatus Paceibacterota bacterium]|nr:hypothetical protein [Candidatus Paceibacterota bacterium]
MKFFDSSKKGSGEWKAFSSVQGDHVDMFNVKPPKLVHLRVKPGKEHHQQLFVLKHAR